jgi:6-phosphogluconolactonase
MLQRTNAPDGAALAQALADAVCTDLAAGITARGRAALAVSGGSTPTRFFAALASKTEIDWSKVVITLVDERWVDLSSERSNARLVNACLRVGGAAVAEFVPLYTGGDEPTTDLIARSNAMQQGVPVPFDAVVLGLGNDGHTASFFPGGDALEAALTDAGPLIAIQAPGAGEARVTQTLPRLLQTRSLYLHIEGTQKLSTLQKALEAGPVAEMPVRAVLRQKQTPVHVYWCP